MPPDGLYFYWVSQIAKQPTSGVDPTGLPRLTRMVGKHLDLFDIDGYGTAMVRVKLTDQGRLMQPPPLPREFRSYLRSDEAKPYRDGVWIGDVDGKLEFEAKVKVGNFVTNTLLLYLLQFRPSVS